MNLFRFGNFALNSGHRSYWKIDCDALTAEDWQTLACIALELLPEFGSVEGVPRGGLPFADALRQSITFGPLLIVDDVVTTGGSLERHRAGREAIGCVVFSRGVVPAWVTPIFQMHSKQGGA